MLRIKPPKLEYFRIIFHQIPFYISVQKKNNDVVVRVSLLVVVIRGTEVIQ